MKALCLMNHEDGMRSRQLSPQIGKFWNGDVQDFWNEIAQTVALQHQLGVVRSAHLFALLNITIADTIIAFFEAKYTYDVWRPAKNRDSDDLAPANHFLKIA